MAVAADSTHWGRELDNHPRGDTSYDERLEASDDSRQERFRSESVGVATLSQKVKLRGAPISQTQELQQEMKLLNWHKLANEAALRAAIIKTNKIKQEDSQFAAVLTQEEREERVQRAQQIIEEEQLKPLQVNAAFFRALEAKGQRDEAKLDDDVQRHIEHLRKLKEAMTQREEMQRRRQRFREKMQTLQTRGNDPHRLERLPKSSNQDEVDDQNDGENTHSLYHQAAMAAGGKAALENVAVVTSLDKLMELEQRIRNLEDAGFALDNQDDMRSAKSSQATGSGLRFAKRRATGGMHEPSKTVYAVTRATKMRARDKTLGQSSRKIPKAATAANKRVQSTNSGMRNRTNSKTNTFLTSLPESKQRQIRRMTDRERRLYLKNEQAKQRQDQARKQDVVIEGWLEKKRAAANQRKVSTSQVRAAAQTSTASRRLVKEQAPPLPRVRAPALGAASGKRLNNAHLQKFDDIKKGFTKRKEVFQRLPAAVNGRPLGRSSTVNNTTRNQHSFTRSALIGANPRTTASVRGTFLPPTRVSAPGGRIPNRQVSGQPRGIAPDSVTGQVINNLPQLQRNVAPSRHLSRPIQSSKVNLPRLLTQSRPGSVLLQPLAARSVSIPSFSRLNKR